MNVHQLARLFRRILFVRGGYLWAVLAVVAVACVTTATLVVREGSRTGPGASGPAAAAQRAKPASQPVEAAKAPTRAGSPEARSPAKATRIASAASAAPGGADAGAAYSDNVDAQIGEIASIVERQLSAKKLVEPDQAEKAAAAFADSLRGVIKEPLTRQQFEDVASSLARRHLWLHAPYPDITDLEIKQDTIGWKDLIRLYLQRKPMTADEKAVLAQQVATLLATARAAMEECLNEADTSRIPWLMGYLTSILSRDMDDPLMPVMKRPFSEGEMRELQASIRQQMQHVVRGWYASPAYQAGHGEIPAPAAAVLNDVIGRIWRMQYSAPSLSPELAQQMRLERRALIEERSKRMDSLAEPEKQP